MACGGHCGQASSGPAEQGAEAEREACGLGLERPRPVPVGVRI